MKSFVAIDFETATGNRNSACSIGIITVENGIITDEYHTLIQPPKNEFSWHNIQVHGISERHTQHVGCFDKVYPEIKRRLQGKIIVAHNESFDRSVLQQTMADYNLNYSELNISNKWECTLKIYRAKGYNPANLNVCCVKNGIELKHHEALSDARACAKLYLIA